MFSGTDDKLTAAVGAAVMGRPVNLFLQYYALDAFRVGKVNADHAISPEATESQAPMIRGHKGQHWSELLKQAKGVGEVNIQACASLWTCSVSGVKTYFWLALQAASHSMEHGFCAGTGWRLRGSPSLATMRGLRIRIESARSTSRWRRLP